MEPVLLYFLKANFAIVALYLFFRLLFYRDTFFRAKRIAMLLSLGFIAFHPWFQLSNWVTENASLMTVSKTLSYTLPTVEIVAEQGQSLSWETILWIVYSSISAILLLRIFIQTAKLLVLAKSKKRRMIKGLQVIALPAGSSPFSFFRWVYLNPDDYCQSDLNEILEHERIHIQQKHSIDALLAELFCAVFWINPFTWIFKRLIRQNLEFLADNYVLSSGVESKNYQYHLLRLSHQQAVIRIGNHFNITDLKQRIIMMNTKKTSLLGLGKYALSLPILAFLIVSTYAWSDEHQIPTVVGDLLTNQEQPLLAEAQTPEAQQASATKKTVAAAVSPTKTDSKVIVTVPPVFDGVDVMPEYPGGEAALFQYIRENLKYPASATEKGIQGRVVVRFLVNATGNIKDVTVLNGFNLDCDNEAVRVVSTMPKWKSGQKDGKNVSVYYALPIVFKLDGLVTNAEPLLLVDGIQLPFKYYDKFKEESIKSIVVLKDTAAIKNFGERGKNGVIQITTK